MTESDLKILIVDDRAICRELLITLLKYNQHQLLEADDGLQALKIISNEHPDLIITDLLMPSMNGYELVQKIKTDPLLAKIPVIFYTASFLTDEAMLLADTCDVKYVLFKPSDPQLILDTVNEALGVNAKSTSVMENKESLSMNETIAKISPASIKENLLSIYLSESENSKNAFNTVLNETQQLGTKGEQVMKSLQHFSHTFDNLNKISNQLISTTELTKKMILEREAKHLLQLFCDGTRNILESQYCFLGIIDTNKKVLKHSIVSQPNNTLKKPADAPTLECSLIKQTLEANSVLQMNHVSEKLKQEFPHNHPNISHYLGVRLITTNDLYGFVYFINKIDGTEFNEVDSQIANSLASEIAVLYENIELYEVIQRYAAKLQITANDTSPLNSDL